MEWELVFFPEIFMGSDRVSGDTQYVGAGLAEPRIKIAKVLAFAGASGSIILGVKVDYETPAFKVA
jgi:hypothetical protein